MKNRNVTTPTNPPYCALSFPHVEKMTNSLADLIESKYEELVDALLVYESFEVATDEIERTLDLLRNISENEEYFKLRIGPVTSFMPRNQPLYAFTCFVVIPSLMSSEVHFRIPHTLKHFFGDVLSLLEIQKTFPNIYVSTKERLEFLKERSALLKNPDSGETVPATEAVIFTGTFSNAEKLRLVFDNRTLFIANGSGHNPIVISKDANLGLAIQAVVALHFYNQGQDCASPNAVLVHKSVSNEFMQMLRNEVANTEVGEYKNRLSKIGPISDPQDLVRIQMFLTDNREWIDPSTPGIFRTKDSIIHPTIVFKPLSLGGNYQEMFAPIIFVQEYSEDDELRNYFESENYARQAMYVTLYGTSNYVESIVDKLLGGKILHDKTTFIQNSHLHAPGVERGTQPYGGFGLGASSLSINGTLIAKPTLPQRDIFEWIVKPLLTKKMPDTSGFTKIVHKNVGKLLQIKSTQQEKKHIGAKHDGEIYLDLQLVKNNISRYVKLNQSSLFPVLHEPNTKYVASLGMHEIVQLHDLVSLLKNRPSLSYEEFESRLYAIPKKNKLSSGDARPLQRKFFHNIYQMLFGKNEGPRLAEFLWHLEESKMKLLDIVDIHDQHPIS